MLEIALPFIWDNNIDVPVPRFDLRADMDQNTIFVAQLVTFNLGKPISETRQRKGVSEILGSAPKDKQFKIGKQHGMIMIP